MEAKTLLHHKNVYLFIFILLFSFSFHVKAENNSSEQNNSTPISTIILEQLLFYPTREAPATVISLNNSMISAEIAGQIKNITVQTGDEVKENDVLANIDCTPYVIAKSRAAAALNAAYARNKYAKQRLADAKHLEKRKVLSVDELNLRKSEANEMAANVGVLNADLKEAIRRIAECKVIAPFDGTIIARIASEGDYANTGSPIVKLLDTLHLEVSAKIQQQDIDSLKSAGKYTFIADNQSFPVKIRTIIPLVDSRVRSYETRLEFIDHSSPSGSVGRLQWQSSQQYIPADYLVNRHNQLGVFIAKNNIAHFQGLKNSGNGLPAPINLPPDTKIITTGRYGLIDGQAIKVIKP